MAKMTMAEAIKNINDAWNKAQEQGKDFFRVKLENGHNYKVKHYDTMMASIDDAAFYVFDDYNRIICRDVSNTEDLACMFMNLNNVAAQDDKKVEG